MKVIILISITILLGNSLSIKSHQNTEHFNPNSPSELASERIESAEDIDDDQLFTPSSSYLKFLESAFSNNSSLLAPKNNKDLMEKKNTEQVVILDGTKGFVTSTKKLANKSCYKVSKTSSSSSSFLFKFSSALSSQEINDNLKMGIDFKSDFSHSHKPDQKNKPIKEKVEEKSFAARNGTNLTIANETNSSVLQENSLSSTFFYLVKITRLRGFLSSSFFGEKNGVIKTTFLNEEGLKLLSPNFKNDHYKLFRESCGNKRISNVKEGGVLLIKSSFVFKNSNDTKNFNENANSNENTSFEALKDNAKEILNNTNTSGTNRIEIRQFGGNTSTFTSFFPNSICEEELNTSKTVNEKDCSKFLKDAINYIRTDFGKQFIPTNPSTYNVFGYQTFISPLLRNFLKK